MDAHAPFTPDANERLSRARADLRMGLPVVMRHGADRALVAAAEAVSEQRLKALMAGGDAVLAVTGRRAAMLKIRAYDGDLARIALPADATLADLHAIIDPSGDLATPMKGPFRTLRGGDVDLHRAAIDLAKAARLLPAVIVAPCGETPPGLSELDAGALAAGPAATLSRVVSSRLPIEAAEAARLHIFRPDDGGEEHYAVEIGQPSRSGPVLVRLHSACFTGDVLGSRKCDCGAQLAGALAQMAAEGGGVLLYLNQEGRGIGLANKIRAYALQDQGFDTVEANHRLGFEDDERDFRIGAGMLRALRVSDVRLLTNNPRKVRMLEESGIRVTARMPLWVGENPHNAEYLRVKSEKSGHLR